ncbi:MAG: hydantoinase B/oxoprolinase family protein [Rhizobiales bacterium]|nr:hydantoinase B/oxoprolinase family protein [Hyphomicrobiales bacterium]
MSALDPVTLQIIWNNLRSIADECFVSLMRSAFSTNIKERHDHSTAITDATGRLIAQAELALPIHIASMTGLMQALLERYGDDINEGDLFVANDPHVAGGTHLPDINMAMPVFHDGELIGFACNIAHHADVGGAARGSMSGGLFEIWQEGLRIPVVKLMSKGELNNEIFDILLLNMRLREERKGDLNAQIAACRLGVSRMGELLARYSAGVIERSFDEIIARSCARLQLAIADLPDGVFEFEDVMDDDGIAAVDIAIRLCITKSGQHILFDFAGTDDQVPGNINLTFNAVQSAVFYALKALLDPDLPNNQGVFEAVEIKAPLGSIVHCQPPAPVALRANTCQRVVDVVFGALADALPDRVIAAANGSNTSAVFAGTDPVSGTGYVYLETLGGGMGGRARKDGKDGVQVNITNTSNLPVEAIETEYPLRVLEYALVEDSGGAGRQRGGMGLRRVVQSVGHTCEFSGVGERFSHQPWGVFGGKPGKCGRFLKLMEDGSHVRLANKASNVPLEPAQAIIMETPGAGGYGPPEEREQEAIEEDRRSGKFSLGFFNHI